MRELGTKSDWTEPEDQYKLDLVETCESQGHVIQVTKLTTCYYRYFCRECDIIWEIDNVE